MSAATSLTTNKHQKAHADLSDDQARREADIKIGEAVSRLDNAILDFVWPGVRSQPHSRIKTTVNLSMLLRDVEELEVPIAKAVSAGTSLPRRLADYGAAGPVFVAAFFSEEARAIKEKWERVNAACAGVASVLQELKQYRVRHAHPVSALSLTDLCKELAPLGGYGETIEELEDLQAVASLVSAASGSRA